MDVTEFCCIEQLTTPNMLELWLPQLCRLTREWQAVLNDDHGNQVSSAAVLRAHLLQQLPYVWIAYRVCGHVIGAATLTAVVPGRHAYIHGVRALAWRKHPIIKELAAEVLCTAFADLNVRKVKAEFEADNKGALGFCRMHGFKKEAHFVQDVCVEGTWKDVLVYSLTQSQFQQTRHTAF